MLHSLPFPSPFPNVAEAVQGELNEYKASEEEVMRLKSVMGVSEDDDPDVISGALSDNTAKLTSAIRYIHYFHMLHVYMYVCTCYYYPI